MTSRVKLLCFNCSKPVSDDFVTCTNCLKPWHVTCTNDLSSCNSCNNKKIIDNFTRRDCSLTALSPIDCSVPHTSDTKNYSAENNYDEFFSRSLHYSINSLNNSRKYHKNSIDNLFIMHFNIGLRSLQRNFDQMHEFLSKLSAQPDIILPLQKQNYLVILFNIELNGYDFLRADREILAGGVGLYIQNKLAELGPKKKFKAQTQIAQPIFFKHKTQQQNAQPNFWKHKAQMQIAQPYF